MRIHRHAITFASLLRETLLGWWEDKAPRFGAALAYYSVLSLAPLLILITPLADSLFGAPAVRKELLNQFGRLVGHEGADVIDTLIDSATRQPMPTSGARLLSIFVLMFGASAVFAQLQDAMDTIWEVAPKPGRSLLWEFVRKRFLSFAMVLAIAFLLLVSLVVTTTLELLRHYLGQRLPGMVYVWMVGNAGVSFLVVMLLFAAVFKILPDARVAWRDVWVGAAITSGLFAAGKFLIGFYLGHRSFGSYYGAAGSVVVLLAWVYFSAQILLLGAEFTHAYAKLRGARLRPEPQAVALTEEARAQQGIPHRETVERAVAASEGQPSRESSS